MFGTVDVYLLDAGNGYLEYRTCIQHGRICGHFRDFRDQDPLETLVSLGPGTNWAWRRWISGNCFRGDDDKELLDW